jgi:hypothetical protein
MIVNVLCSRECFAVLVFSEMVNIIEQTIQIVYIRGVPLAGALDPWVDRGWAEGYYT